MVYCTLESKTNIVAEKRPVFAEERRYMIGVLTHHWAKADKINEARDLLDGNGLAQSKAPGFGGRQTLYSIADQAKITTLVVWDSNEIYDAWRASPERAAAMAGAEDLWSRPAESERFQMAS